MTITAIRPWRKGKSMIFLNDEPAFVLYAAEIRRFGLGEGMELPEELKQEIYTEVLTVRARQRAIHLLDRQDRSALKLREKLLQDAYPEEVADRVVEAALRGRYLDDRRYARQYVREKLAERSRRRIEAALAQKGIPREYVEEAFEELEEGWEDALIRRLILQKSADPSQMEDREREKLYQSLIRKGFSLSDIRRICRNWKDSD